MPLHSEPIAQLRQRFLVVLGGSLVAVLLIAMANNYRQHEPSAGLAEAICAGVLLFGWISYLLGRWTWMLPRLILMVDFAIIHLLYVTLRGNTLAGAYSLTVMFPLIASYFLTARRSLLWSGALLISLLFHVGLAAGGVVDSGLIWSNLVRIIVVYLLVVYITLGDRWITEIFTSSVQKEATTQAETAERLRHEVEAVKEVERAKSLFVSLASHQLRSPLTALRWSLETLVADATNFTTEQRQIIASAQTSIMRLIHLVTELLNVQRIESGRLRVVPEPADMVGLVNNAVADVRPLAEMKNLTLDITVPPTPMTLTIDAVMVSQVVISLLSNAIKYSPPKSKITMSLAKEGPYVKVTVQDHGIGIPPGDTKKIFQQMFRATNAQRMDEGGSGLGLFLAKSIVALSGGEIGFTSTINVGSTFWFTLPIAGSKSKSGEIGFEKTIPI